MMSATKNILVFCTDQLRADALGCMGNDLARTPTLDRLAERGVLYRSHYAANPVCMPSRAAFVTGRHCRANGVVDNGVHLPADQVTMPEVFRENGYRTASFGKLHFQTYKSYEGDTSFESRARWESGEFDGWTGPYYGFETVRMTCGHGDYCGGEYGRWRDREFPNLKLGAENAPPQDNYASLGCYKSNMPLEAHASTWVADRAIEYLNAHDDSAPFYMNVSFPDPHHPFCAPAPYNTMFDDVDFPDAHAVDDENDTKPKPYRDAMTGRPFPTDGDARFFPEMTPAARQAIVRQTHGMLTLIDDSIGRVLQALEAKGLAENTIVVFTSDHGDFLGDHHLLFKGQIPCRSLLNIPLIIVDPDAVGGVVNEACGNVDVMPTLLQRCGLPIPDSVQGVVLPEPGERASRDYAFEAGWSKASPEYHHATVYTNDWRISVFPYLQDGEMYDLNADPWEHRNLYHDAAYQDVRHELMEKLTYAVGMAEPQKPPVVTDW